MRYEIVKQSRPPHNCDISTSPYHPSQQRLALCLSTLTIRKVRRRTIVFYCSDGTLSVSEPEQENTGLVQGCIFKRQKVTRSTS